jgi:hypothetical protein
MLWLFSYIERISHLRRPITIVLLLSSWRRRIIDLMIILILILVLVIILALIIIILTLILIIKILVLILILLYFRETFSFIKIIMTKTIQRVLRSLKNWVGIHHASVSLFVI